MSDRVHEQARTAAARFRRDHALDEHPIGDLATAIEQATGIGVAVLDGEPGEHGLTLRDPVRGAVCIGVARTGQLMRQRHSLAHELGHVLFGDWVGGDEQVGPVAAEVRADLFARHLLVPHEGLRVLLGAPHPVGEAELSEVVHRFLVSPAPATIALHEAGYADAATRERWQTITTAHLAGRYGWADHYRALCGEAERRRPPRRLLDRAVAGYRASAVTAQMVATLCRQDAATVEAELRASSVGDPA